MEEDIKILEEFIKIEINIYALKFVNIPYPRLQQAIEHLIKAYKQLEEENKKMAEEYLVNNPGVARYLNENYIFKSKVKEKMEELEKEYNQELEKNSTKAFILKCKIEAIKELLGEE